MRNSGFPCGTDEANAPCSPGGSPMKILTIAARRWEGAYEGCWELCNGVQILTQVARLEDATQ